MVNTVKCRGFSLIEVIIAVAILAFSLLGIVPLLVNSIQTTRSTSVASRAQILAAQRLQELQTWPAVRIQNSGCLDGNWCDDGVVETVNAVDITRQYRFDTVNTNGSVPNSYIITVSVSYNEGRDNVTKVFTTTWLRP